MVGIAGQGSRVNEFKSLDDVMTSRGFRSRSITTNTEPLIIAYWRHTHWGHHLCVGIKWENRNSSMIESITVSIGSGPTPIQVIRSDDIHFVVESLANSPHLAEDA